MVARVLNLTRTTVSGLGLSVSNKTFPEVDISYFWPQQWRPS